MSMVTGKDVNSAGRKLGWNNTTAERKRLTPTVSRLVVPIERHSNKGACKSRGKDEAEHFNTNTVTLWPSRCRTIRTDHSKY